MYLEQKYWGRNKLFSFLNKITCYSNIFLNEIKLFQYLNIRKFWSRYGIYLFGAYENKVMVKILCKCMHVRFLRTEEAIWHLGCFHGLVVGNLCKINTVHWKYDAVLHI